jgi:cysteine synthase A
LSQPSHHEEIDRTLARRDRDWVFEAVGKIEADFNRSSDTHLIKLELPCLGDIDLYLKDESTHPTGSLKHRLARSLMLYGLCNGWIRKDTPIIESSSGSTAISEAYFSQLLGLPFIAVVPDTTVEEKIAQIEFYGGECRRVAPKEIYQVAGSLAERLGGHYLDQFTFAERATDWRGNNNIAQSMFSQMAKERFPTPKWVVVSAGTGGTSSTIGRYIRYRPALFATTRLCVVDPENSVFFDFGALASRASGGRGWSRHFCRRSSTACCAYPTRPASPRSGGWSLFSAGNAADRPEPTSSGPCSSPRRCCGAARPAAS